MNEPTLQDQIDAARAYESLFIPAMFGQWAKKIANIAQTQPGQRVLDVACGTGVLAREIASHATSAESIVGLDPGPGMLAVAEELAPELDWQ